MAITQTGAECPAILDALETINPNSVGLSTPVGILQAAFDPTNRTNNSITQLPGSGTGHKKFVRVAHKQRGIVNDLSDTKTCGTGVERPYLEDTFEVTNYLEKSIKVSEPAMRKLCEAHSAWQKFGSSKGSNGASTQLQAMQEVVTEILLDLNSLRVGIARKTAEIYAAKVGAWKGGDATKTFPVYRTTSTVGLEAGGVIPSGFNTFNQTIMESTFAGTPLVFGNGNMYLATKTMGYGCCNTAGVDISKMDSNAGYKLYADLDAPTILGGANNFGVFMPGSIQFAMYNEYLGDFGRPIGTMQRGVIPDPIVPGLMYDVRIKPNECDEYYDVIVGLNFDLWVSPLDMFQVGDELEDVNGAFIGIASNV